MCLENHSSLGSSSAHDGMAGLWRSQLPVTSDSVGLLPLGIRARRVGQMARVSWASLPLALWFFSLPHKMCFVTLTRSYLFLFFPFSLSSAVCVFKSKVQQLALCPLSSSFSFFHYALFFFLIYSYLSVSYGIFNAGHSTCNVYRCNYNS